MSDTITVKCLCGASTFSTRVQSSDLPLKGYLCHCDSCRHGLGTLCNMGIVWPFGLPENIGTLTKYAFSAASDIYFCTTCGSHMFGHQDWGNRMTSSRSGVLQNAGDLVQFQGHIHVGDTEDGGFADWLHKINGRQLSRLKAGEGKGSESLPKGWKSEKLNTPKEENRLPAYCLCRGVEFYVTRPHAESSKLASPLPDVLEKSSVDQKSEHWWLRDHDRYLAGTCACNSCRLAAGVDVVQWAFVSTANIKMSNGDPFRHLFGTMQSYQSSEDVTRYFCGRCGANVFWTGAFRPDLIDIAVGLFDAASGARAEDWFYWVSERVSFEEDAKNRGLVDALGQGLALWKEETPVQE